MSLGVQYYRAPFPEEKYWEDDMKRIADSGLDTVQLWVLWSWVEPVVGEFRFEDYDRLVKLADQNGLGVVLSTIAEVQPHWILDEIPDGHMIDHMGNKVVSSNRNECHFGITPGGCTDHPGVWYKMQHFLGQAVSRYKSAPNLRGWDAWNELRWNVQADGLVCFCRQTLREYRNWLEQKYGDIDGLNAIWKRRYGSFDEIMPGKLPGRPYTDMMMFQRFLTWRANKHGRMRYEVMKDIDEKHPITVHAGAPSPFWAGHGHDHAINRGNDWFFADDLDGVGCSSFPKWQGDDDASFAFRVDCVRSAAQGKLVWLSEVQGGRAATGVRVHTPVDGISQQRWLWNGIACGADTILFWCWRDEVFGHESGGFGMIGLDGFAEERVAAMQVTGKLVEDNNELLQGYKPKDAEVGVFFSPQSYYYYWAQEGSAQLASSALSGYGRALAKRCIPTRIVEEEHLDALEGLRILFMPRVTVTDEATEQKLRSFVEKGGTLVCESECGSFDPRGIYRYPEDRFTSKMAGIKEVGRRAVEVDYIRAKVLGRDIDLAVSQWFTPWERDRGIILSDGEDGINILEMPVGKGKLILCGTYLGDAYAKKHQTGFEDFIEALARLSGWRPDVEVVTPLPQEGHYAYIRHGRSGDDNVVFVFFPKEDDIVHLRFRNDFFAEEKIRDIVTGMPILLTPEPTGPECTVTAPTWRYSILIGKAGVLSK